MLLRSPSSTSLCASFLAQFLPRATERGMACVTKAVRISTMLQGFQQLWPLYSTDFTDNYSVNDGARSLLTGLEIPKPKARMTELPLPPCSSFLGQGSCPDGSSGQFSNMERSFLSTF